MFTTGRIIFALAFFVSFVVLMIYAYRKDLGVNRSQFPKAYKILIGIVLIIIVLILIVKFKSLIMK